MDRQARTRDSVFRDSVPFWPLDLGSGAFLTPGSGIRNRLFLDPGSRIPKHIFESLMTIFWVKIFYNYEVRQQIFSHPSLLLMFLDPGSRSEIIIRNIGKDDRKQNITLSPHWWYLFLNLDWMVGGGLGARKTCLASWLRRPAPAPSSPGAANRKARINRALKVRANLNISPS